MEILKIIETLQSYSEDVVKYKLDGKFAHAVTEAVALLVAQGEKIAELEAELKAERHRHDRYVDFELAEAEELRKLKEQNQWIPRTKPPEVWKDENGDAINFLVVIPGVGVDIANWIEPTRCWFCIGVPCKVTHWMPLPEPPKEDGNDL